MSIEEWNGIELMLGNQEDDTWLHFITQETPDFMYEHWQNMYEAENQDYYSDLSMYDEER